MFGLALGGLVPASTFGGAAWAQDDGGHEDGKGHEGGGGQHGRPVPPVALPVLPVADGSTAAMSGGAGATSGNHLRLELGAAFGSAGDANWLPPGYPSDPQVFFDLDMDTAAMAAIGFGRDYGNAGAASWR